ncbi:MAG: 5-methyltetrahydropteroyltriglutamate--homocysteine S-methyltransferase [Acidobacteria bacterium]|nr:5-methyltetrahydropteroyltriglutamate--homocysteine S-methyltransferase [Acidobacteriota bacterium]
MTNNERSAPPFRAEHIGSLLRPPELIRAHHDFAAGKLSPEDFRSLQDNCIREVVKLQEDAGLKSITDGEFRRGSYFSHFIEALEGMEAKPALFSFRDATGKEFEFGAPHVAGKLQRKRGISTGEFEFLRGVTRQTPKITMPSPSTMHFYRGRMGVAAAAYPDEDALFEDLVQIYREELAELVKIGAQYIQFVEVPLAMLCDPNIRKAVQGRGEDPDRLGRKYIEMLNAVLRNRPAGLIVGLHLCRGNYKARWLAEGGYGAIADQLFGGVDVDAFFLEYDTPRAGDFAPLRSLNSSTIAVLGLISSKTPEMEPMDLLKRRVAEASQFVPMERLAISPQCGFATSVGSKPMTRDDQIRKLELIVNAAREIWT